MSVRDEIHAALKRAFRPTRLEVIDESARHAGHAGAPEGGDSHFRVRIAAPDFADKSRLERHRAIHTVLGADLMGRIHALALHVEDDGGGGDGDGRSG